MVTATAPFGDRDPLALNAAADGGECGNTLSEGTRSRGEATEERWLFLWIGGPLVAGALLGLVLPQTGSDSETEPWRKISEVVGWAYFAAWSVSFYPQVVQNYQRRSVVGLSLDYQMLNIVGFSCYFAFNAVLFWNPRVKQEYFDKHGKDSAVQLNDVLFAGHAAVLSTITVGQVLFYWDYPPLLPSELALRRTVLAALAAVTLVSVVWAIAIFATSEGGAGNWLTYFSVLSEVKVAISVVKYCPQVWMNFRRKSTEGWSIVNVLLDFSGGMLSIAQLVMDAIALADWSAITGDPAKFLLGNLSMFFDVIFMAQHYCCYRKEVVSPRAQ